MAAEAEAKETERRRGLSEEERAREDRELEAKGLKVFTKEKRKWGFLQKYYHKGAFYMDEDSIAATGNAQAAATSSTPATGGVASTASAAAAAGSALAALAARGVDDVRLRAADGATGADAMNKMLLPQVMQVKNWGKRGRTKWTHLAAEDTSAHDDYHKAARGYGERKFGANHAAGMHGGVDPLAKRARTGSTGPGSGGGGGGGRY